MVKKGNKRITITLTEKQEQWIREQSKLHGTTPSKFIKWLMDKNIGHLISRLPEEDLKELIRIAKVKWLDLDDDDEF